MIIQMTWPSSRCTATSTTSASSGHPLISKLVLQLAGCSFGEAAHNVVLVGGPGAGESHPPAVIAWRRSRRNACNSSPQRYSTSERAPGLFASHRSMGEGHSTSFARPPTDRIELPTRRFSSRWSTE